MRLFEKHVLRRALAGLLLAAPAQAVDYTNSAAGGDWDNPNSWIPSTGYPTNNDTAAISSNGGVVWVNYSLVSTNAPSEIRLYGGTIGKGGSGDNNYAVDSPISVLAPSQLGTNSTDYHYDNNALSFNGEITGTYQLTKAGKWTYGLGFSNTNFSGGWYVKEGGLWTGTEKDGALGTGMVVMETNTFLGIRRSIQTAERKPAEVRLYSGATFDASGGDGVVAIYGWKFVSYGGILTADGTLQTNVDVYVEADSTIRSSGTHYFNARMHGTNKITINGAPDRTLQIGGDNSDFSGPLEFIDRSYITSANALGASRLVSLMPFGSSNADLRLDIAGSKPDWTLTNNIAGSGSIKVEEDGDRTLTLQGSTLGPGANAASPGTNSTGILSIWGSLAFAKQDAQYARLNIEIAGADNAAGVDYDRLAVSSNFTGLSNAILSVSVATNLNKLSATIQTQIFEIVWCGNDLTDLKFNSVTWSNSWRGLVEYTNGYIRLKNVLLPAAGTLIILR